jgi:hypothetical protein
MRHKQKAWLLAWEWCGEHAAVEDRIAAILRPHLSQQIVGGIVESLYAIHAYTPCELALWSRQPKKNPYRAQWYDGHCYCGHNPSLHANYVHDLVIEENSDSGLETIRWILPPLYRLNKITGQREQVRGELPESATRTIAGPLSDREINRMRTQPRIRRTVPGSMGTRCNASRSSPQGFSLLKKGVLSA